MTTQTEALNIAIDYMNERLEEHDAKYQRHPATEAERNNILADIETVKTALAQPEQEPVAWFTATPIEGNGNRVYYEQVSKQYNGTPDTIPLYTTPLQRKPLTNEQAERIINGLRTCLHLDSKRVFLKTWLRDWAAHGIHPTGFKE